MRVALLKRVPGGLIFRGVALLSIWLGSMSGVTPAAKNVLDANSGFCLESSYGDVAWPEGKPKAIAAWTSYCAAGDKTVASAATAPFRAEAWVAFYLAGYPGGPGVSLELENLADHSKLSLKPHETPSTHWLKYQFVVPESWVGKSVRLIATDAATGPGGWVGFSQPVAVQAPWAWGDAAALLLRTISHFLLLLIPCAALCAWAVWRGVYDTIVLGAISLLGLAVPGYLVFWLWLLSPRVGHAVAFLVPLAGAAGLTLLIGRRSAARRAVLKPLLFPAILMLLSSLWTTTGGFAYGGMRAPFITAWTRFSHPLPPDNTIPFLFAEGARSGHVPSPLLGDWLSSDRPPLQTAIALSHYPYTPQPRALGHTALAVLLQSSWIAGVWLLLVSLNTEHRAVGLVLAITLFSGFTLLNSFFVWPKLLAATFVIALSAILLNEKYLDQLRQSSLLSIIAGALAALGLLAHGGSIFALIGLFFTMLFRGKRVPKRALGLMLLSGLVLYSPWIWYQKFYDPPGDHLLKMHLAGVDEASHRSLLTVVAGAYGKLTFGQWIEAKEQNAAMVLDHERDYWTSARELVASMAAGNRQGEDHAAADLRIESFFYFAPNLGLLAAGPFFLLAGAWRRYRTQSWRTAVVLWTLIALTLVFWCLLMFTGGSTSIHQGSYLAVLLAMAGSVLALWNISPLLAYLGGALQILESVFLYGVFMRQSPAGDSLLEGTPQYATITLFFVTFALSLLVIAAFAFGRIGGFEMDRRQTAQGSKRRESRAARSE